MPEIKILGDLEILKDGRVSTPSPPMVRRILALMAVQENRLVPVASFVEELWGESPPRSAETTVRSYVYQLRKMLISEGFQEPGEELLVTRPPGYLLRVPAHALDAHLFERLAADGRAELTAGRPGRAADLLRRALGLWTGRALANVSLGRTLHAHVVRLEEQRLHALELRIQADLELKRHRDIIGELRSLVATHPLNEWFHGQLIVALARSGRRSEALQAYQHVLTLLRKELGLDPSPDLQRLQYELLTSGRMPTRANGVGLAS
jgi:SARP family transcriptional regulator, regulator of embCAB operon